MSGMTEREFILELIKDWVIHPSEGRYWYHDATPYVNHLSPEATEYIKKVLAYE